MFQPYSKQTNSDNDTDSSVLLQLLLFVDERPSSQENIQQIHSYLESLKADYPFELQVIEIAEQPHLVEHFRLLATPALVKIFPAPRQTLAGSNLVSQLKTWWHRWQTSLEVEKANLSQSKDSSETTNRSSINFLDCSAELIRLSDEIFRLEKEKEQLSEQLKFKDQVLAMLAHDLRSPLTAASIAVETLELSQNQPDTERSAQLKKKLYKQSKHQFQIMNRMITDILEASKSMSAKLQLQPRPVYLQSLCEEILSQFQDQFQKNFQKLEKDIPQDLPAVYADEELLRQVIVNLLENAMKYTPEEGKISFSILHRTTQKIQVSVCDTGLGIPKEKHKTIFEDHFRLDRDEAKDGYGLGLSLCRKIIQAHYGQIWVDSTSGTGSCFHFTLPVYR
ncbi:MAG: histidine kinase [Moorea sp. SIO2B7]|nr:histidine kinase [Moorena sp. SIO2B7]